MMVVSSSSSCIESNARGVNCLFNVRGVQHRGQPDDMREQRRRRGVRRRAAAGHRTLPAGIHSGRQQ